MEKGVIGQIYEMGTTDEFSAYDMAVKLISTLKCNEPIEQWINYVKDRPFHDTRYMVNHKTLTQLGWSASTPFDIGLTKTIEWYTQYAIPQSHWGYDETTIMITKI